MAVFFYCRPQFLEVKKVTARGYVAEGSVQSPRPEEQHRIY